MKKLIPLLFLFLSATCYAQNKSVIITGKMLDPSFHGVSLDQLDGWYFRPGNDTGGAKNGISTVGWQKLKPLELSAKYADKNGRVEGWFRIKLKLAADIKETGFSIYSWSYAPADIFVNGKHVGSAGNTGLYRHAYAENDDEYLARGIRIPVKTGEEFVLTLHIADTLAPFAYRKLRSELRQWSDMIYLSTENTEHPLQADYYHTAKIESIYLSVMIVVGILFWLFVIHIRQESVFFYIALWDVAATTNVFCNMGLSLGCSSSMYFFYNAMQGFSVTLIDTLTIVIVTRIVQRKMLMWVIIVMAMIGIYSLFAAFFSWQSGRSFSTFFTFGLSIYYIISSWRNLRGGQWSIVAGLLATFLFLVGGISASVFFPDETTMAYILDAGVVFALPLSLLVFVAMRFKEMLHEVKYNANEVVRLSEEKKEEALNRQRLLQAEVDRQIAEIRANQARLIQSEKMASLGELTAGIAHEIQNPLNFVNNFSEVNQEMIDELEDELKAGNIEDALAIAADIKQNEEKINHHGKRADSIVKGMLEHSRAGTGEKLLVNINALTDEFLKLSYHGLRAKDKTFNAEMITHFDENLPKIKVVQQDIGRVLINLFNNAFYAVNQKAKKNATDYKPTVEVSTFAPPSGGWGLKVKDNGNGIPDSIKEKIMQPFFTTKPTGEGTGLGLSLSYDIVVKGHAGSINVNTKESEYTEFIITLPIT